MLMKVLSQLDLLLFPWFELLVIHSQHYSLFKFVLVIIRLALEEFLLANMVDM